MVISRITLSLLAAFILQPAQAQSPGRLQERMKFIEDTLSRQGVVKWVQAPKKAGAGVAIDVTDEVRDVKADAPACTLSFTTDHRFPNYQVAATWTVPLRDIDKMTVESGMAAAERFRAEKKLPSWESTMTPDVFYLQLYTVAGRPFAMHQRSINQNHETTDRDRAQISATVVFREKQVAEQIAGAMRTAKELCGPGK